MYAQKEPEARFVERLFFGCRTEIPLRQRVRAALVRRTRDATTSSPWSSSSHNIALNLALAKLCCRP